MNINSNIIDDFLIKYPGIKIKPSRGDGLLFEGFLTFHVAPEDQIDIKSTYEIRMFFPHNFPKDIPKVYEIGNKIPHDSKYHIERDGSICLGSPLRIRHELSKSGTLISFVSQFLIPYLYAITFQKNFGNKLIFGELSHGTKGLIEDYSELLDLSSPSQIRHALSLLGMNRRTANKKKCPCGCSLRYGKCNYRTHLEKFRHSASREWFNQESLRFNY